MASGGDMSEGRTAIAQSALWQHGGVTVPVVRPLDIGWILRTLWRGRWMTAICGLTCLALGLSYILLAPRLYTASTSILIGPRPVDVFADAVQPGNDPMDMPFIDSQVEVLKSSRVLGRVAAVERLAGDQEFATDGDEAAAVRKLKSKTEVRRVGLTYVVSAAVTTQDPQKSARIANAIAKSFLDDNVNARSTLAQLAANWLQSRVDKLRDLAISADARVQAYRAENNIVSSGKGLITDQKITELTTKLIEARAKLADGTARASRIKLVLDRVSESSFDHAVLSDQPASEVISGLRAGYLANKLRIDELLKSSGPQHQSIIKLKAENRALEESMRAELQRLADSYDGDLEVAEAQYASLQKSLDQAVKDANISATAQVQLRDLEREAESYRSIYQMSLLRLQEATQRETFPINEYRIIADAEPPVSKSWPLTLPILGLALAAGVALGALLSLLRAQWNVRIATAADVEDYLGQECLGVVPLLPAHKVTNPAEGMMQQMQNPEAVAQLRKARLMLQPPGSGQTSSVICVASTNRGEGRSTVAWALARGFAASARRTVLIDADFRKPDLTRFAGREADAGLFDILMGTATAAGAILEDERSHVHFLPAGQATGGSNSSIVLEGRQAGELLVALRQAYDVIVIDTGPLSDSSDALALAPHLDSCLYVVRRLHTWSRQVKQALQGAGGLEGRIAGYVIANCGPGQKVWG